MRELFKVIGNRGARHKVGEATLRKADQLVGKCPLLEAAKALEAYDVIAGLQRQGSSLPGPRRSELCLAGLDPSAKRSPIIAAYRIKAFVCPICFSAAHEGAASGLAHDELCRFENTQRFPQRPQADAEFSVKVHLTGKESAGSKLAGPYALQHRIANLQVERSDLKFATSIHVQLPRSRLPQCPPNKRAL